MSVTGEFGKPAPTIGSRMVAELLRYCEEKDASDLHLAPGHLPLVRIDGDLVPAENRAAISAEKTIGMSEALMNSGQRAALTERGAADGAVSSPGGARFRFNIFR